MSIKDCGHHKDKRKKLIKRAAIGALILLVLALVAVLITWAVLRPAKPNFLLQDATVYSFNLTSPTQLTSVLQVTVQSRNPNARVGVYYDGLIAYATYHDQQITLPTSIPPTYQDTRGYNLWSPFLQGQSVPIAPYIGAQIDQDRSIGGVKLVVKMDGRLRFRVGSYISGTYRVHVNCPAAIPLGSDYASNGGVIVGNNAIKYQLSRSCSVSL